MVAVVVLAVALAVPVTGTLVAPRAFGPGHGLEVVHVVDVAAEPATTPTSTPSATTHRLVVVAPAPDGDADGQHSVVAILLGVLAAVLVVGGAVLLGARLRPPPPARRRPPP